MAAALISSDSRTNYRGLFAAVAALPFVREHRKPIHRLDLWAVESTGEHMPDEIFGTLCADKAIQHIRDRRDVLFLQNVLCAMIRKGECGPIEIAFVEIIAQSFTELV